MEKLNTLTKTAAKIFEHMTQKCYKHLNIYTKTHAGSLIKACQEMRGKGLKRFLCGWDTVCVDIFAPFSFLKNFLYLHCEQVLVSYQSSQHALLLPVCHLQLLQLMCTPVFINGFI